MHWAQSTLLPNWAEKQWEPTFWGFSLSFFQSFLESPSSQKASDPPTSLMQKDGHSPMSSILLTQSLTSARWLLRIILRHEYWVQAKHSAACGLEERVDGLCNTWRRLGREQWVGYSTGLYRNRSSSSSSSKGWLRACWKQLTCTPAFVEWNISLRRWTIRDWQSFLLYSTLRTLCFF